MPQARLTGLFAERYLIERELGHGASAVVYLAQDRKHDRQIALKVLSKDLAHALGPQRFLREIHVTSRLHHPHILPIYDSGESNGLLYYVLPFVRGESLRERIDREKQLPMEECIRITCEVADALANAHAAGVIHRDVKPENIMISDGHALLSDFGIARTLDIHTGERLTSSGLIVGTSAYMSPEQASGEENVDARSDIYSLACVLYEMIAGVQPFIGPTTQAVIAQRFTHTPRPVSTYRPAVPPSVETVLEKALATAPADRYQSVKQFSAELSGEPSSANERMQWPLRRAVHGRQKAFGFAAVALVVITAAFVIANPPGHWRSMFGGGPPLDSTKYAVIPIVHNSAATQPELAVAGGLYHALEGWKGLSLADPAAMSPATAASLADALELAKRYGAGRLIISETLPEAGHPFIAALYDVRSGGKIRDISSPDLKSAPAPFSAMVNGLLRLPDLPKRAEGGEGRTHSLPALLAYGRGHIALSHWDIPRAKREFQTAVSADPVFAPAMLWRTMLNEWTTLSDTASWKDDAARVSLQASNLGAPDSVLAVALGALARGDYPAACAQYRALASTDSLDFVAPFGLGDCQSMDDMVLPAPSSPSGWRFRSSFRGSLEAYARAFKLEPGAYALVSYTKLQQLLPIRSTSFRLGHRPQSTSAPFPAFPSIDHDTLAFVPYPMSAFAALPASATETQVRAIERNLEMLFGFITKWTRSDPRSADAEEALADVLETRGDVGSHGAGSHSASEPVSQALRLTSDPIQRIRLTATEIRLRIKRREFSSARALADSLLAAASQNDFRSVRDLLAVAASTGRIALSARLLASMTVNPFIPTQVGQARVPAQVRDVASSLLAHAALGDCSSATSELMSQLANRLETYVSENDRASIRTAVLARPASMLAPCTGARSALEVQAPIDRLLRLQQAFARNDRGAVRAMFDTLAKSRRSARPGDLSMDYTYQEAWLRLALGDTLAALRQLDHSLEALATLASVHDFAAAAALGRAMVLRADVASARGDRATAGRYATAVAELWASSDAELQPLVVRMRTLASLQTGGR